MKHDRAATKAAVGAVAKDNYDIALVKQSQKDAAAADRRIREKQNRGAASAAAAAAKIAGAQAHPHRP